MRSRMLVVLAVVVAILAVASFLFWGRGTTQADTIVIGHIAPLTGDAAVWGVWEREGIDLAVDEINSEGGVDGKRLVVMHEDDQGDGSVAVSAIQNLITARNVHIVIGGTLSGTTLAMAPVAMRNKVVLLSPSAQSPKISHAGNFIFRIFASTTVEGSYLASLIEKSGVRSVGILYINNDFGGGLNQTVVKELSGHVRITADEAYAGDTRDFRTHIQKVVGNSAPEAIMLLGYQADVATIVKQMAEVGIKARIFAPNSFEGDETVRIAGTAAEGVIYDYPVLPDTQYVTRVRGAFKDRYGRDMNIYNGVGYDAVKVLAYAMGEALKTSKTVDGDALKNAMHNVRGFAGVTGPITIDKNGDVVARPFEARVYRNGRFVRLER